MNMDERLKKILAYAATIGVEVGVLWLLTKNENPSILKARFLLGSAKVCQAAAGFFGGIGIELEKAYNVAIEAAKS